MSPKKVSNEKVPVVIIGAGVVGCATAHAMAKHGLSPLVLERGPRIAEGVTSRNSGVIHAGIYYPPGSLKAESCVRGNALLYEWCAVHGVPHRKTGKWILGSKEEERAVSELLENARASGAKGLELVSKQKIHSRLKSVAGEVGIYSAETRIVDAFELSRSFQMAAEEHGAQFLMNAEVRAIERLPSGGYRIESSRGPVDCEAVVNAAGLYADEIARLAGISKYKLYPCRGDYFKISGGPQFDTLIYPMKKKNAPGLGVHLTVGLDGSQRLGPDTTYVDDKENFAAPKNLTAKQKAFFEAARHYLPDLRLEQLSYDTCGLRPKLRSPTDPKELDFILAQDLPGFLSLIGIESPGLTASIDLAERIMVKFKR